MPHSITIDPVEGGHPKDGPFLARCDYCGKEAEGPTRYTAHQAHYRSYGNRCGFAPRGPSYEDIYRR